MFMKTVLVIEDDFDIRKMIRDYLELQSFIVLLAEDGEQGIEFAKRFNPDLIICDVKMPKKDGYEVKKELSSNSVTQLIPFIYLTSQTNSKDLRTGMELGADDYLFKPFNLEELGNSIDTQLEKREKILKEFSKSKEVSQKTDYNYNEHVLLKVRGNPRFVKISSIVFVVADEKYTRVHLDSGEKLIISKSLKNWEESLPPGKFVRTHRSTIINIEHIAKVEKWFNRSYKIKLINSDEELFISRRYYSKLKDIFNG